MNKRPLCLCCLSFTLLALLLANCMPKEDSFLRDSVFGMILEGKVYRKGNVLSGGEKVFSCWLEDTEIIFPEGMEKPGDVQVIFSPSPATDPGEEVLMGGRIRVRGKALPFLPAENPGGFDALAYYGAEGISFRMKEARLLARSPEAAWLPEALYRLRVREAGLLERLLPPKEAGLLEAMLLGEKTGMDEEVRGTFERTGIVHILTISGTHITILGMALYGLFRRLWPQKTAAALLSLGGMTLFGLMVQGGGSTIRAILMFGLHLAAESLGRTYDLLTALSAASFLLLCQSPAYAGNTGFLFSFGALSAIAVFKPLLMSGKSGQKRRTKDPPKNSWQYRLLIGTGLRRRWEKGKYKFKEALSVSAVISLITLPVCTQRLYAFPLLSLPLNLLILPLMGFLLTGGFWLLPLGELTLLFPFLEGSFILVSRGVCVMLGLIVAFTEWADGLGSSIFTGPSVILQVLAFYGILSLLLWQRKRLNLPLRAAGTLLATLILLFRFHPGLEIYFLSVGQGDGIFVRDGDFTMLIDGGSTSNSRLSDYTLLPFLKYQGVQKLNLLAITHWDEDHYNGILELLESDEGRQLRVERLLLPETGEELHNINYQNILAMARSRGIPVSHLSRGSKIAHGMLSLEVMNPLPGYSSENLNDYSLVFRLGYGSFSALLTGDLTGEAETEVTKVTAPVTCLKVAHHGSDYSTPVEFLARARPEISVISVGKNNRYGHPGKELLERLEEIGTRLYRTDEQGAVTIRTDGERVRVSTWLKPPSPEG